MQVGTMGANRFYEWRPNGRGTVVQVSMMGANRFYEWRPDGPETVVQVYTLGANGCYEWRPDGPRCVVQVSTMGARCNSATRGRVNCVLVDPKGSQLKGILVYNQPQIVCSYLPKYKLYVDTLQEHQWNCRSITLHFWIRNSTLSIMAFPLATATTTRSIQTTFVAPDTTCGGTRASTL